MMTPAELDAYAAVMQARGIADFACGGDSGFRITLSPHIAARAVPVLDSTPMTPFERQQKQQGIENQEDADLLYAAVPPYSPFSPT